MKTAKWTLPIYSISLLATALLYSRLPSRIPIHWNISGEVDRLGPRPMIFLLAALPFIIEAVFMVLPMLDPRKANYKKHERAYSALRIAVGMFMVSIHWVTMLYSLGSPVSVSLLVPMGVGILFMVIGNFLPQVKPNWFVGIRLPWTLADDKVWKQTHRLGGWLFTILGVLTLASAIISPRVSFIVLLGGIVLLLATTVLYSLTLYRRSHSDT
ncbi:SdpI family protein [Myxococcota bacterium]|nr:SdpI family protein [Myxococcota bacterium]MBU1535190.1 SdpI family protein [Myxococcota bacterium]